MYRTVLSHSCRVWLFATLWTSANHAPLSMGFSRQEYWSGLPFSPSRESSQPRDQTHLFFISCIGRQFLKCKEHEDIDNTVWLRNLKAIMLQLKKQRSGSKADWLSGSPSATFKNSYSLLWGDTKQSFWISKKSSRIEYHTVKSVGLFGGKFHVKTFKLSHVCLHHYFYTTWKPAL